MLALHFKSSVFPISVLGMTIPVYAAVAALVVNLALCCALTPVYRFFGEDGGEDATTATDYAAEPVSARARPAPDGAMAGPDAGSGGKGRAGPASLRAPRRPRKARAGEWSTLPHPRDVCRELGRAWRAGDGQGIARRA